MSVESDVAASTKAAVLAQHHMTVALIDFQQACRRMDWPAVEEARVRVLDSFDAYLDQFGAIYKRLESR